jgi:hypothetical protein
MASPGQKPGQAGVALDWGRYVDGLAAEHGSLAAVADRLASARAFREDQESIARALRRLRGQGSRPGGKWGDRLLTTFGLPGAVDDRLRFMGSYHARFVDLPVALCADLIQLWDRPPTSESHAGRGWLSLARATLALRRRRFEDAEGHLATAAAARVTDPAARIELALGQALLASRARPADIPPALAPVPGWLEEVGGHDADCLRARWVGQIAHALNHAGDVDRALALHGDLPDGIEVAPFARSRRANGLAYGHHRRGETDLALLAARRAATFAGDAGHVRLRAMALLMVARVAGASAEGRDAHARAASIARALGDEILIQRCAAAGL